MAKYIAKIPVGGGSFRYIYTPAEMSSYKSGKSKGKAESDSSKKKKKKKKSKGVSLPSGHMATSSPGSVISGYKGGAGKPSNYTDEQWAEMQKRWGQSFTAKASVKKKKKSKTALRSLYVSTLTRMKTAHKVR